MPAPAIVAATTSSNFSGLYTGANAIDLNFNTDWVAGTNVGWLRLQLASAYAATGYRITSEDNFPNRAPKTWTFEGSTDGSIWDVLDTRINQPVWPFFQMRAYTFTNTTPYTYYRLNVSANHGDTYLSISELFLDVPPAYSGSEPFPSAVMADNPSLYYRFSEPSGSIVEDSSGNGVRAILTGTYTRNAAGLLVAGTDPSTTFGGASLGVLVSSLMSNNTALTLEAIIHPTTITGGTPYSIWDRDDESANRCWQFRLEHNGALLFLWWNAAGAGPFVVSSVAGLIAVNGTYHVMATYDGTTARLYINGTQVASLAQAGTIKATSRNSTNDMQVGRHGGVASFLGRIDEAAAYVGSALSPTRAAVHAAAVAASAPTHLRRGWGVALN